MSGATLTEDHATIRALDDAVAAFKAALGSDDGQTVLQARTRVYEALLVCTFRAARVRGERRRARMAAHDDALERQARREADDKAYRVREE